MTSKQAYQVSNESDYRAMVENFSIDQLQAHIKQHELELQGNSEMAEYAGPYDASPSDYEHECQEIEAYLAIDREILASKQAASQKWVIEASAPIDILSPEFMSEPEVKPAKKVRKPAAKKSKKAVKVIEGFDGDILEEIFPKESDMAYYAQACQNIEASLQPYEEIDEAPGAMDSAIEDLEDEMDALLAREYSLRMQEKLAAEAEALHEENPLQAPSNEEMENMALALQPLESIHEEEEEEYTDLPGEQASPEPYQEGELTDRDFTQFVEKLEVMAESPASKAGKAKKASKPEKASNGQFWDNAYDGQLASNQAMYEGPCDLPEGFKIPADRAVMVTPEKGRIRYNLYGRIAECPGLWFKYGNIGGYWKAYRLADLQKWIEDRAGKEPFLMKEPNIPAAKMGMVLPKPEKPAKPEKVTLPAGDISIKRADQKAMMAELRLLRHVNEINAYVSFGILPELTLEDSKAFKVMQAYLDSEKIWLFGFNEGEQASKDPYYAIEASEGQLNTLCEIFQIKRA